MENLIYILLIVMAAAEVLVIAFVLDGKHLASITSLALAMVGLILLIRIFYLQRRLDQLQIDKISEDLKNLVQDK